MVHENEDEETSQGGSELIPEKNDESGNKMRHVLLIQKAKLSRWRWMLNHTSH